MFWGAGQTSATPHVSPPWSSRPEMSRKPQPGAGTPFFKDWTFRIEGCRRCPRRVGCATRQPWELVVCHGHWTPFQGDPWGL